MILLDTNYLIMALVAGTPEEARVVSWASSKEPMITAAICWYEFLCGPVTAPQISVIYSLIERVVPFGEREAAEASRLFNAVGRMRKLRIDSMIGGTAIATGARMATNNEEDYSRFVPAGLQLAAGVAARR
ncbi:MAG: PIN domain-containing protein [Bryobacteraceae bacterium]